MIRDARRTLKAIKKELEFYSKQFEKNKDEHIYEYILMLDNRYKRIKNGSKGQ
jgi:hypothetical protein